MPKFGEISEQEWIDYRVRLYVICHDVLGKAVHPTVRAEAEAAEARAKCKE